MLICLSIQEENYLVFVLELIWINFALLIIVDVLSHLPDLHDIILRNGADHPSLIRVPREVRDLGSMASMNKLKLIIKPYTTKILND